MCAGLQFPTKPCLNKLQCTTPNDQHGEGMEGVKVDKSRSEIRGKLQLTSQVIIYKLVMEKQ